MSIGIGKQILSLGEEALKKLPKKKLTEILKKLKEGENINVVKPSKKKKVFTGPKLKKKINKSPISEKDYGGYYYKSKDKKVVTEPIKKIVKKVKDKKISNKKVVKKVKDKKISNKKVDNKKQQKVFSKKDYDKTFPAGQPKVKKTGTQLVTTGQPKKGTSVVTTGQGAPNIPKNITTKSGKVAWLKQHFKKNWKRYAIGMGLLTAPYLIGGGPDKGGTVQGGSGEGNKDKKKDKIEKWKGSLDFGPSIEGVIPKHPKPKKPKTGKVIKKKIDSVKKPKYTGKHIGETGDVAYDSIGDFFRHMTGTQKEKKVPKGLRMVEPEKKGATMGLQYSKQKKKPKKKSRSNIINSSTYSKNLKGGGIIASFYDKPTSKESYKGNKSSARQVKGWGKARKRSV